MVELCALQEILYPQSIIIVAFVGFVDGFFDKDLGAEIWVVFSVRTLCVDSNIVISHTSTQQSKEEGHTQ
jgi:hypothetical protein